MVQIVLFVGSLLLLPSVAHAEKRIALLIGNQSYTSEIGTLANPHNDIALLEQALKGLRFEVTLVRDAGLAALHQAVNAYARRVRAAGPNAVGFFYYAGHGAADVGTNYLIPVDAKSVEEGDLWDMSLRLTELTRKLKAEAGNATHFVVFDACRNNLKLRQAGTRALVQSRGFVPVVQESGMLIAYATAEGELASDVGAGAGPYASALAEEIVKPGVEAVTMFRNVQRRVRATINQEPYLGFNALGDVYLAGLAPDPSKAAAAPARAGSAQPSEVEQAWDRTKDTTSIALLESFSSHYKDTFYAELARARIAELRKQALLGTKPATPPAPVDGRRGVEAMTFFVTSVGKGNGADLGGLDGADAHCRALAKAAGSTLTNWRAYLSTTLRAGNAGINARDRIGKGPWHNAKGELIARNVDDLHTASNKIAKLTALTEKGEIVTGSGDTPNMHDILTGSDPQGMASTAGGDTTCGNWSKSGEGSAIVGHHDRAGKKTSWNSAHGSRGCSQDQLKASGGAGLLYCFAAS